MITNDKTIVIKKKKTNDKTSINYILKYNLFFYIVLLYMQMCVYIVKEISQVGVARDLFN